MTENTLGLLSLFTAATLYGSQNIATRIAGETVAPFLSTAIRAAVVVVLLVWFVPWKRLVASDRKWFIARSCANILSTTGLFFAISKIPVGTALFSFYAGMILATSVVGNIWYHERMTPIKYASLVLTVIGLLFMYYTNTGFLFNMYIFTAAFGGMCAGLWSIFSRPISHTYPLTQLVVLDNGLAAVLALGISFVLRESWTGVTVGFSLVSLIYLGLTQAFTGQLVAHGFKHVDGQVGGIVLLNDTIIGILLMVVFFKEIPSIPVVIGGICIFLASILPAIVGQKKGNI